MERIRITDVAKAIRGKFGGGRGAARPGRAGSARGVSTDSRTTKEGDLFVALRGPKFDGHDHVAEAFARGAVGAIVDRDFAFEQHFADRVVLWVKDTRAALLDLAAWYRRRFNPVVIAITGSNGKTTTKELVAAALGAAESPRGVVKSPASYNNAIGVPLTLFQIGAETRYAVVEIGSNRPGEIAELARVVAPTHGIVTSIGPAHLEGFGSLEAVAEEKGALFEALPREGVAFVNADDPLVRDQGFARGPDLLLTYGTTEECDVFARQPGRTRNGDIRFLLFGRRPVRLPIPGVHNVANALAATAVAMHEGVALDVALARLRAVQLPEGRLHRRQVGGVTMLRDTYNANPASVRAALHELHSTFTDGRHVAILGDMLEMGTNEELAHREIGRLVATIDLDLLWAVGPRGRWIADGAEEAGMAPNRVLRSGGTEEANGSSFLPASGDVLLFKGSRGMELEKLADEVERRLQKPQEEGETKAG